MANYVTFTVDDHLLQEWFVYAGYKARNARVPLTEVAYTVIRPGIEEQFATEGMRTGGWEELNDDYSAWKYSQVGFKPILQFSGDMKNAMEAWDAYHITQTSMHYNPDVPDYAHWHQTGGTTPGRPPQRQMVVVTTEDEEQMEFIFTAWLDDLRFQNRRRPNFPGAISGFPEFEVFE